MNATTISPVPQAEFVESVGKAVPWFAELTAEQQAEAYRLYVESGDELQALVATMQADTRDGFIRDALDADPSDTDLEGQVDTVTEPAVQEPTHTVKEYQDLLSRWEKLRTSAAEANYAQCLTAYHAVLAYVGSHPGKAQRSTAISELARRAVETDPDAEALYPPAGKDPVKWYSECVRSAQQDVNKAVQGGAVLALLFGATLKESVVCTDGNVRKAASKAHPAMAWRRVRELFPLVRRVNPLDEHVERWELLPFVGDGCKALVGEMCNGLKAEDVVKRVRTLCIESALQRQAAGDKEAAADLEFWQGKLAKSPTAEKPQAEEKPATAPAAETATDTGKEPKANPKPSAGALVRPADAGDEPRTAQAIAVDAWNYLVQESRTSKVSIGDVLAELMAAAKDHDGIDVDTRNTCITWLKAYSVRKHAHQPA